MSELIYNAIIDNCVEDGECLIFQSNQTSKVSITVEGEKTYVYTFMWRYYNSEDINVIGKKQSCGKRSCVAKSHMKLPVTNKEIIQYIAAKIAKEAVKGDNGQ